MEQPPMKINETGDNRLEDIKQPESAFEVQAGAAPKTLRLPPFWRVFWQGKVGPAFWTISSLVSLVVNVILIVILVALARELFGIKALVQNQLVGGLYTNFQKMDAAHIKTNITVKDTIHVNDTIPVVFTMPLQQKTTVTLTKNTPIEGATIFLNGARVPLNIVLPKGTPLNIALDLTIPVSQTLPVALTVPVSLNVPVDIPLEQTELHEPFVGLQNVLAPYQQLLAGLPNSWKDTPFCGPGTSWLCRAVFKTQ